MIEKQITVSGAVRRPAKYEIKGDETLQSAVALAGGSLDRSELDMIRLERMDSSFRINVKNLSFFEDESFTIMAGDQISLSFVGNAIKNSVSIIGAAENVGEYEWKLSLIHI